MNPDGRTAATPAWWGPASLAIGRGLYRRLGGTELWLVRDRHEWRFASRYHPQNREATEVGHGDVADSELPTTDVETRRLGCRNTNEPVRLSPRLADRPVVIRPAQPIALPAHEELVLYFTSPLWLQVEVGDPLVRFVEIPLQRPSDTWFGPSTREGEMCYALRTSARLELDDVPHRPHRALTELHVVNLADTALELDRLQVPLPLMSLYASGDGQLWTEIVTLERRDSDDKAELKLQRTPPARTGSPEIVARPREEASRGHLFRAFGGLIGGL
jgi:hypothetical protein